MKRRNVILLIVAIIVLLIGGSCYRVYQRLYGPWGVFGRVDMSRKLMAQPDNYKPAAVAMARLLNTESKLLKADLDGMPPNWTPVEIGRLGSLQVGIYRGLAYMSTTSGLAEFNGYKVERDNEQSDEREDAFTLQVDFGLPQLAASYEFKIPKGQGYTEEELVRGGLAELDRRMAARANRTDPAVSYNMSDPVVDRQRLLDQHPEIAKKLGFPITTPSTMSTTSPL